MNLKIWNIISIPDFLSFIKKFSMIKLSNIFDNVDEFIERIQSSNLWNEDKQFILDILTKPYKIADVKYWKILYNFLLDGLVKNLISEKYDDFVNLFDYSEDELKFIYDYINESGENRASFIKSSISKIFKSNEFKSFLESLKEYDTKDLFNLNVTKEEKSQTTYFEFIVNGIKIGEYKLSTDLYSGNGSNIRSVRKKASDLNYISINIRELMNSIFNLEKSESLELFSYDEIESIFKSDYHNVRWGYTGPSKPTNKIIINKLQELYNIIYQKLNNR